MANRYTRMRQHARGSVLITRASNCPNLGHKWDTVLYRVYEKQGFKDEAKEGTNHR